MHGEEVILYECMNEIYELKNEISLLRSLNNRNENKSTFWKLNSYFLKKKIQFSVRSLKINKNNRFTFRNQ